MTDKPDTTREAVERLAAWHDGEALAWAKTYGERNSTANMHRVEATTLRTLAADNDALRAEVAALRQALTPFAEAAYDWDPDKNAGHVFQDSETIDFSRLRVVHLRAARATIRARAGGAGDE